MVQYMASFKGGVCMYYYKGVPLAKYCMDNNINISTVRSQIWRFKKSEKYASYTDEEIIELVIDKYNTSTKYMYKGVSLRKYCLDNGISINTIRSRISKLKKDNPSLTDKELVDLAMIEEGNKKVKFFYNGMSLREYCNREGINYNTIKSYINRESHNGVDTEEVIEKYLEKEHKGRYKYYYLGMPLIVYAKENNLNYDNIISYIQRCKSDERFNNLSLDCLVEAAMGEYQPFKVKYFYQGLTLREYCIKNNISYYSVVSYIKRRQKSGSSDSVDKIISDGINEINRHGIIYYYNGMPLTVYAKENNLNINSIRLAILREKKKGDRPLQEIVDECVCSYQKRALKYCYKGMSLRRYCASIGINYNTVIQTLMRNYSDLDTDIDKKIEEVMEKYINNSSIKCKYYFGDRSLLKYCSDMGYNYFSIYKSIKRLEDDKSIEGSIVEEAIKKYEDKLEIKKINSIFDRLKLEDIDINEIKNICKILKISFDNVVDLVNMEFSYNQAINMIWYFSDKKDSYDYRIITDKKLEEVFMFVDNLKLGSIDINNTELYDLIGVYKAELYDTRLEIIERLKKYISKTVYSLCMSLDIKVNNDNFSDFESEVTYDILRVIDRSNLSNYGQIIKYIDLSVKGCFRTYLIKYKKYSSGISFSNVCESDRILSRKIKMECESGIDNLYSEVDTSLFSQSMKEALLKLSSGDLEFIMLKYSGGYSNIELSNRFNLSSEEVAKREGRILSLLKNSVSIAKKRIKMKQLNVIKNDNDRFNLD